MIALTEDFKIDDVVEPVKSTPIRITPVKVTKLETVCNIPCNDEEAKIIIGRFIKRNDVKLIKQTSETIVLEGQTEIITINRK